MAAWCTPTAGVRPPSEFTRARAHMRAGAHAWQECMRCAAAPWQRHFAATHDETLPRYHSSSPRRDRTQGAPLPRYHSTAPGVNARNPEWYIENQPHGIDTPYAVSSARPTPRCVLCACERLEELEARLNTRAGLKGVELQCAT